MDSASVEKNCTNTEQRNIEMTFKGQSRSSTMASIDDDDDDDDDKHENVYGAVIVAEPLREFTR